jgi:nitrate/TMAO reductase-like tetraheme cytochrome c subunit
MERSTFSDPFVLIAFGTAALSALVLVWYLVRRPPLTRATKFALLIGIGVLPIATAANGNVAGYHATKTTRFCGSCHVMTPYTDDAHDPHSMGLASRHSRNEQFGEESCYTCHADYGMFGTVTTKLGGMRHVYLYVTEYHAYTLEEAREKIHIQAPFPNATCIRCHSTKSPQWNKVPDHLSSLADVRADKISCASVGCHNYAHPFSKPKPEVAP